MGSYTEDFRLNPDKPEHQAVIAWLAAQGKGNKSKAIRNVLIAYVTGGRGGEVTNRMLLEAIRQIRAVQAVGIEVPDGEGTSLKSNPVADENLRGLLDRA